MLYNVDIHEKLSKIALYEVQGYFSYIELN